MVLKKEKEIEQERLAQEMNFAKRREKELLEEIDRLDGNIRETQKIYEEKQKKGPAPTQIAQQISDQENMRRRMFEEKAERIANLKARQNNLMAEKNTIEKMQTELREGQMPDREAANRLQERINVNAQKHLDDIKGVQNFNTDNFKRQMNEQNMGAQASSQFTFGQPRNSMDLLKNRLDDMHNDHSPRLSRPMSKQALLGQNIMASLPYRDDKLYISEISPTLEVLDAKEQENQRLKQQIEQLQSLLNGKGPSHAQTQPTTLSPHEFNGNQFDPQPPRSSRKIQPPSYQQPPIQPPAPQYPPQRGPKPTYPMAPQPAVPQYEQPVYQPLPRTGPKDFDDFLQSNFMQNQMKNVDLTEDERILVHFTMMEADALRMLERIPQSSELYRFKLEQYKELSTQRAEAEKLVQETRLKKMKRALEMRAKEEDRKFDNQRFLDDVRKQDIAAKLAKDGKIPKVELVSVTDGLKDLNPKPNVRKAAGDPARAVEGEYNIDHGFVVHWDYVFGVPKNKKFCQLVYAIMNGDEAIIEPQVVDPRPTQDQNTEKNQCIIYENNNIREIEPSKMTNLIIEVQMPTSMNNVEEYTSLGWTFINLFDLNLQLNRGKFKLPLYQPPIYKNVTADAVDQLRPVMDCAILFRISYPWKDEYSNLKNLEPHLNHRDYVIPSLHVRQASIPGVLATNLFGATGQKQAKIKQALQQSFANASDDEEDDRVPGLPAQVNPRRQPSRDGAPSMTTKPETPHDMIARSKGIRVIIHNVHNIKSSEKVKVAALIMSSQFILRDDLNDKEARQFTTVHNPSGKDPEDGPGASDKKQADNVLRFEDTLTFMINIPKRVRQDRKDVYLVLRVLETGDQIGSGPNKSISMNGGGKYQTKGWYCHKLNEANGKVMVGTFEESLFAPPEKSPPIDPKDFISLSTSIEYSIEELTGTTVRRKLD